jgi:hypothetical protein
MVTEADLKKAVKAADRDDERRRESFATLHDMIRAANAGGLSYDRIAAITGRSKTQVQRICGA